MKQLLQVVCWFECETVQESLLRVIARKMRQLSIPRLGSLASASLGEMLVHRVCL